MRYILDDSGYIYSVSCNPIECNNKGCTGYTGAVPEGYDTIEQWATTANIRAYKIVDGQLVYDADRAAELEEEWSTSGSSIVDLIYPIGSIYMSINATDPKNLFGGKWERIQGKFLLGANDSAEAYKAGKTGGSVNHTHNLDSNGYAKIFFGSSSFQAKDKSTGNWTGNAKKTVSGTSSSSSFTGAYGVELGGKTASADGMPPFLSVYIWKRTA